MKKIGIFNKFILPGCLALVGLFSSCSMFDDYLTVYPTNQITGEQFWEDKNDLTAVLACTGSHLHNIVGTANNLFVMLNDNESVAEVTKFCQ